MGWIRHPHTTQERRASLDPEAEDLIRASRNWRNLPDAWDDKPRGVERSWKAHRKTRWRE